MILTICGTGQISNLAWPKALFIEKAVATSRAILSKTTLRRAPFRTACQFKECLLWEPKMGESVWSMRRRGGCGGKCGVVVVLSPV